MATVAIEIGVRDRAGRSWNSEQNFKRELPAVIFEAVSKLALEHGVVLRTVQVIERKPQAR
jgi:hypothetical protein